MVETFQLRSKVGDLLVSNLAGLHASSRRFGFHPCGDRLLFSFGSVFLVESTLRLESF